MKVNGETRSASVPAETTLLALLRDRFGLTGSKLGCDAGDGVAAVAALTEQIAAEAIEKIVVDYEPLPAVFDPLEAMREDAPKVHAPASNIYETKVIRKGDADAASPACGIRSASPYRPIRARRR